MAKSRLDDRPVLLGEPPDEVSVTVTVLSPGRGRSTRERVAGFQGHVGARVLIGFVSVAVAIIALVAATSLGDAGGTARSAQPSEIAAVRIAAAYDYPPRCSSVAIALHDPRFAAPDLEITPWCARHAPHPTVILRRDPRFK
jgi:hypothetical protein